MLRHALLTCGLMLLPQVSQAQEYPIFHQEQATPLAREKQYQEQFKRIQAEDYRYSLAQTNPWRQTLWATALLEPQQPYVEPALASLLDGALLLDLTSAEAETVHLSMQVGIQLYLGAPHNYPEISKKLQQIVAQSPDATWAAMALSALSQGELSANATQEQINILQARFANSPNLSLQVTLADLQERIQPTPLPPLADLLRWQIEPQQAQLYVFCRPRREVLCRGLLKDSQGNWVTQEGEKWSFLLLSKSLHRLRWNFVRGDTPAGVYRIQGTMPRPVPAEFRAFGQFPLIKVFLPRESSEVDFVRDLESYRSLLPPSWRGYFPLEGTYWAGKLGRSLIRIHGSGENPELFAQLRPQWRKDSYNPAIGCLSALEIYDNQGKLLQADMPEILQNLRLAAQGEIAGYLVVVEIPGSETEPVSLAEIEAALNN